MMTMMIDYGSVYEAILADNRQMRKRIKLLDSEALALAVTLREVLADLEVHAARVAELEETLQFAAQYKGIEGRGCPLCHYEDGVYIASCQMHSDMEAQAALIEQLTQELRTVAGAKEAATADEPGYFGSTTWKGWTVDLYSGDDDDE